VFRIAVSYVFIYRAPGVHGLLVYVDVVAGNDEACVVALDVGHGLVLRWSCSAGYVRLVGEGRGWK
jgi:hypothetical protein